MRVICGAAVILAFAEDLSVREICGAAVLLVFTEKGFCESDLWRRSYIGVCRAEQVSVRVICVAAVIVVFAEEVCVQRRCLCE